VAKQRVAALGTYPDGTYVFGPIATPNGLAGFDVRIGRNTAATPTLWLLGSTLVTLDLQFSYDGGNTYTALGANSWSQGGGVILQRGIEAPESVLSWKFSPTEPDHLKGQIVISGGPITTYLDVTVN
jgi:hypothetical protein